MIRLSPVLTIARKELREIARDRRTLFLMVGLPLLVYPLMIVGMSKLQESQSEAQEARRSIVAVWSAAPGALEGVLRSDASISIRPDLGLSAGARRALEQGPAAPEPGTDASRAATARRNRRREGVSREPENPVLSAARVVIGSRTADAVVVAWPGFERAVAADDAGRMTVYFDSVREESALALDRIDKALDAYRRQAVERRQDARGLPSGFGSVLDLSRRDVAPPSRQAGRVLGSFLPFLLISLSLFGGFYPAVDLTAGEKERGTLQTLLCAPLQAIEIVTGKFLAVWAVALGTALINVTSLSFTMARLLRSADMTVPFAAYALTATMLVPVTLTTAALFIAVAVFARDFKDGQNFLTPVYMLLVIPAGATMLPASS